jgi:hypothetical protein
MNVEDLFEMSGPVAERPTAENIERVEAACGVRFPPDYVAFVKHYGSGSLEDVLWVLNPASRFPTLDVVYQARLVREAISAGLEFPEPVFPWGVTFNGDYLLWDTSHEDPRRWSTVVRAARQPWFEKFPCGCIEFLSGIFRGRHQSEIIGEVAIGESRRPCFEPRPVMS